MENNNLLLVNCKVLPPVFSGVVRAKELLATGQATSTSQAVKMACISRSAFYKYRDFVFKYTDNDAGNVTLSAVLSDKAGVFSALTAALYKFGANIMTLNQGIPVDGVAAASLTISTADLSVTLEELAKEINSLDGIISVKII